ncbi:metal ABC transporter permease [Pseudomonas sp. MPC6]|uniref:metal ABC transporter permease n=1 Tax=unclassified Pseudomonas TaxID=196821 RepID=UPI0011102FDB|nr:metal ABC transporter permease [Pseudomonas sp. MPC6]QCY09415.1 metal ABC transporter permease [Pseudomonas sp. MPC6]
MTFLQAVMEYDFLQKALLTSAMVGIICGVIGCFIILRGMALMGDAISHAVLPGVALSYMLGINLLIGAVLSGLLTAIAIGYVSQHSRIKHDVSIGVMFTAAFALGIILITLQKSSTDLYHILFGNVLAVRPEDMWITLIIGSLVLSSVYLFYKELLVSTFDATMAAAYGLPVKLIHYFLMTLLTLVTVASLQTVGIVLVVAMLITPAATAYLLTNRLSLMICWAAGLGLISAFSGIYLSFTYNLASGATIVMTSTLLFLAALLLSPSQGLIWRALLARRRRHLAPCAAGSVNDPDNAMIEREVTP